MSWEIKQFKDVVQFPPKITLEKGESYSFIPMEDLSSGIKYVSPKIEKVWSGSGGTKFEEGDTLFARITPCLQNGKISQAKNLKNGKGFGSTEYFIFRGIENVTDSDFIYYFSLNEEFKKYAIGSMVGASGRQRADQKFVGEFEINLPPLETQKRIASILSTYDDLIENNLKRIKLLEETAQNIYKEWFVNFRFPNFEHTAFDAESGLPVGWERCRLTEIFDIQGGTQPPKSEWKEIFEEGYIRMIQIRDYYTDAHIAFVKDKPTLKKCTKTDIMIARYGASVGRICWGLEGSYNVALAKVIPIKKSFLSYLRWYLRSDYFQSSLLGMTQRTAQDGFNKETFNSIFGIKPDDKTLNQFENIELKIFIQIEKLKEVNEKLKEARDILLPRLMNKTIEI